MDQDPGEKAATPQGGLDLLGSTESPVEARGGYGFVLGQRRWLW